MMTVSTFAWDGIGRSTAVTHCKSQRLTITMDRKRQMAVVAVDGLTTITTHDRCVISSFIEYKSDFFTILEIFTNSSQCQIAHYLIVMSHIHDCDWSIILLVLSVVHWISTIIIQSTVARHKLDLDKIPRIWHHNHYSDVNLSIYCIDCADNINFFF